MLKKLRRLMTRESEGPKAAIPQGERVYAVGDIHGRLDLFDRMIAAIETDDVACGPAETTVVLLGDLVDRGPDSAGVVARARKWQSERRVRILAGNHEEMFLKAFDDLEVLKHFLRYGGKETVLSYGIHPEIYRAAEIEEVQAMMHRVVPREERDFLAGLEDTIAIGDYLFVHAGVHPDTALDQQLIKDLRWIREPFLSSPQPFGAVVVHGHTIADAPVERANRIGIDTGAYVTGRLTALVLEGESRRYLEVSDAHGEVADAARGLAT